MKKILIVDDDKSIVDLLISALAADDRVLRWAHDGKGALNWINKEVFDLVICDLMMPKVHGFQLIDWIKANPECSQIKIIVLTAKAYRRDSDRALQSGASLFISKPFEVADLQEKVKQMLS